MPKKAQLQPRVNVTAVLDVATAKALYESADEAKLSVSQYARKALTEHIRTEREQKAEAKRLREQSES